MVLFFQGNPTRLIQIQIDEYEPFQIHNKSSFKTKAAQIFNSDRFKHTRCNIKCVPGPFTPSKRLMDE